MIMNRLSAAALAAVALAGSSGPALAHHAMGGSIPDSLASGLLSGLAHPVIGIDHLAFVAAAGIAAAATGSRLLSPLAFVAATVAGCLLQVTGFSLPAAEIVVAASILLLGGILLSGRTLGTPALLGLFAVAGLFHGWAYGESIVGAEPTPLVAYLAGFAAVQYAVATGAGHLATRTGRLATDIRPRLAGAMAAGIGVAFLVENLEALLFA